MGSNRVRNGFRLTWPVSIASFVVPLILLIATLVYHQFSGPRIVTMQITDQYTGAPLSGALVTAGVNEFRSDADGEIEAPIGNEMETISVQIAGYEPVSTDLSFDGIRQWPIALRPSTLAGSIVDAETGTPIGGATVQATGIDGSGPSGQTGADGTFLLADVPAGATLRVESPDYGVIEQQATNLTRVDLSMRKSILAGRVTDLDGAPIDGARVSIADGSAEALTDASGVYRMTGVADAAEVLVSAPGFKMQRLPITPARQVDATLQAEQIRAIYAPVGIITDPERFAELIDIANTTEINAIVLDVKQDNIFYDTQVQFFRDIPGVVTPLYDPRQFIAELEADGIYTIARMVVFKDPLVAEGRQDLAVKVQNSDEVWRDDNGSAWVNAFYPELWQANADLAGELARLGFDEVQYDYIRFPSDGNLKIAEFGNDYTEALRREAIVGAVDLGAKETRANGAVFAADLFPIVALLGDDQGIGQTVQDIAPLVDYVCLMIYPSHYTYGNIPGVDGHPNDFPAETVTYTLERAEYFAPGTLKKMRPWLQDFTYPVEGFSTYGPKEVREQIDAADAFGASGWLLWNAASDFEVEALRPQS